MTGTTPTLPPVPSSFTSPVASRRFDVQCNGLASSLLVELGQPVQDVPTVDGFDWRCPVRFTRSGHHVVRSACGVDSYQALELALELVHVELTQVVAGGCSLSFLDEPYDPRSPQKIRSRVQG